MKIYFIWYTIIYNVHIINCIIVITQLTPIDTIVNADKSLSSMP